MNTLFFVFFLILGIIIGSFLNVVLFRFNTGRGIGGRSKCFSCRRVLGVIDLVPVLSFLAFKGRCRTCKSAISWQYPTVELLTGVLFASTYVHFAYLIVLSPAQFIYNMIFSLIVMALLVLIVVYDLRHMIIPDLFVFLFALTSLIYASVGVDVFGIVTLHVPSLILLLAGLILSAPFYILWRISAGRWMGLGDAKLAVGIGWLLGLVKGFVAIILGFYIGAVIAIFIMLTNWLLKKFHTSYIMRALRIPKLSLRSEIPFAPFLVAGLLIVFFFGYNVVCIITPQFCSSVTDVLL